MMVIAQKFVPVEVGFSQTLFSEYSPITFVALGAILQLCPIRTWSEPLVSIAYGFPNLYPTKTYFNTKIKLLRIAAARKAERDLKEKAANSQELPPT